MSDFRLSVRRVRSLALPRNSGVMAASRNCGDWMIARIRGMLVRTPSTKNSSSAMPIFSIASSRDRPRTDNLATIGS